MTKKTKKHSATAAATMKRITEIITSGRGIKERIEAQKKLPPKYSRDDGVRFDPKWQDDWI